jgi:hypothetical protein
MNHRLFTLLIVLFIVFGAQAQYQGGWNAGKSGSKLPRYFEDEFKITLKNDSIVSGKCSFDARGSIHTITTVIKNGNPTTYRPTDTKQVMVGKGRDVIVGYASDSTWLFNFIKGKINGYARLPMPMEDFTYIRFIQKGDGPILKLTLENLKPMVSDNKKVMAEVERLKLWQSIKAYNN